MGVIKKVVVLDYGSGNVRSAVRALERVGAEVSLTCDFAEGLAADGLLVPGVGAYGAVMSQLEGVLGPRLIERRLAGGRAVLGICVGLQVLFDEGIERGQKCPGLGQWPGVVERLESTIIPHMGWTTVRPPEDSQLFTGIGSERFYFVHSNACRSDPAAGMDSQGPTRLPLTTWANHGVDFVAAVENGPLCATQFHPEKSGEAGLTLLENWLARL